MWCGFLEVALDELEESTVEEDGILFGVDFHGCESLEFAFGCLAEFHPDVFEGFGADDSVQLLGVGWWWLVGRELLQKEAELFL